MSSIAILKYEGVQLAAVYGLKDLFDVASQLHREQSGKSSIETFCIDQDDCSRELEKFFDVVIFPPSLKTEYPISISDNLKSRVLDLYAKGSILSSVCAGAFLLADLDLLNGRNVTTHWALDERFAKRYPEVKLNTNRILIDDGDIITAGGMMAWTDLGLHLIGRLLGQSIMLKTARYFIVDPGGREQRFYRSFSPVLTHGDEAILRVQRWLQTTIGEKVTVEDMLAVANLGRRTFLRRFKKATGLRSTEYLQYLCVSRARELLEMTDKNSEQIAWDVGYEDAGAFRRVFIKIIGITPAEYRRRFKFNQEL